MAVGDLGVGNLAVGEVRVRRRRAEPMIGRSTGRSGRPQARPPRPLRGPRLGVDPLVPALACDLERPDVPRLRVESAGWRLTDRGIAVIIAAGLAIATAALVVIGLTAMRVTADGYAPFGISQLSYGVSQSS